MFRKLVSGWALCCGVLFPIVGIYLMGDASMFTAMSVYSKVQVTIVERRDVHDDGYFYKPHFLASTDDGKSIKYSANSWVRPKPHEASDIVDGRVNWASGEIRSWNMMQNQIFGGVGFFVVGFFIFGLRYYLRQRRISAETARS